MRHPDDERPKPEASQRKESRSEVEEPQEALQLSPSARRLGEGELASRRNSQDLGLGKREEARVQVKNYPQKLDSLRGR